MSSAARRFFSTSVRRLADNSKAELKKDSKKNPEVLILGAVVTAALGGAGYYFGANPTKSTSETAVHVASNVWEAGGTGKYKYYPGGDPTKSPKDAPSALNVVVVPGLTLPADVHERYNKWGKDGYP
ncbi:hypothetical protein TD95_001444 [Thielaviopsis punctulata]|uniref:Uncharacterized protein n=1 Tax=Thielaviopsis punctulata TaxID=72032 RepID=A0A0F4ZBC2_9PEZI|nr:hypothetical protein TD95_001444 [Thielaviopsis punctulata]